MHVQCPGCSSLVETQDPMLVDSLKCSTCGALFQPSGESIAVGTPLEFGSIDHFDLFEELGRGAHGVVWKAFDNDLRRWVALKSPLKSRIASLTAAEVNVFVREAQAAAALKHPNIVSVHHIHRPTTDAVFIVTEYVEGIDLKKRVAGKAQSPQFAARICAEVADRLHHAHQSGILHRDVKPSNILLTLQDQPKVADFGLAQKVHQHAGGGKGEVAGTPGYMAPEQISGRSPLTPATDVYSLGVVLYELLTGRAPFAGVNHKKLFFKVFFDAPTPPRKLAPRVPKDLENICLKCLEKEPQARYPSAAALADDLRRFLRGEPVQARPIGWAKRAARWARRHPAQSSAHVLGALLTVVFCALAGAWWWRHLATTTAVEVAIVPAGASVVFHPLDPITGAPRPEHATHCSTDAQGVARARLAPGDYLVVAWLADGAFHEVWRRVPKNPNATAGAYSHTYWKALPNGAAQWNRIMIPPVSVAEGMAFEKGAARYRAGAASDRAAPEHHRRVPAYWLDTAEVTVGGYRRVFPDRAPVGYHGEQPPADDEVLERVNCDEAMHVAERLGKRLPDEFEIEFAATNGGTTVYPWGDAPREGATEAAQPAERVQPTYSGDDRTPTDPPIRGLFSGVAEWTTSWPASYPMGFALEPNPGQANAARVVRGAAMSAAVTSAEANPGNPRFRCCRALATWEKGLGFRCARSAKPRVRPEDFGGVESPPVSAPRAAPLAAR